MAEDEGQTEPNPSRSTSQPLEKGWGYLKGWEFGAGEDCMPLLFTVAPLGLGASSSSSHTSYYSSEYFCSKTSDDQEWPSRKNQQM